MSEEAAAQEPDTVSAARSLAARDAGGVMLGLATLLERRRLDDDVDPHLVATTLRRLRRVGTELLGADDDDQPRDATPAPPDGVAWATQLSWLLARSHADDPATGPDGY